MYNTLLLYFMNANNLLTSQQTNKSSIPTNNYYGVFTYIKFNKRLYIHLLIIVYFFYVIGT